MELSTLENDYLKVNISSLGAELVSLIDKEDGIEHMWEGNPKFWPRKAPILFPCVGESKNREVTINGTVYPMGRHGFARLLEFNKVKHTPETVVFELRESEETLRSYPFSFAFRVGYELNGKAIIQKFEVVNADSQTIGFQVGGHPAFAVPFGDNGTYNDYEIKFDQNLKLERHLLTDDGLYSGETRTVLRNESSFDLYYDLFREDALVFKNISSKSVCIQHKNGGKKLRVDYSEFPHLGIWSIPGADYVCIEPWIGCADNESQVPDFFEKDSIVMLEPSRNFSAAFTISIEA